MSRVIHGESHAVRRLREQVERALEGASSRRVLEPLLERLVATAPAGSDAAILGHRRLAELRIGEHPWRALLHLKQVLAVHPDDDIAHAMNGLAHAMSGHHRAAVASYRAAVASAPENPWYRHNLGHILDVALDRPTHALPHLRAAFEALSGEEPEVIASLVHCLSRLDEPRRSEARELLAAARATHPRHAGLRALAKTLEGAPASRPRATRSVGASPPRGAARPREASAPSERARATGRTGGSPRRTARSEATPTRSLPAAEADPVVSLVGLRLRGSPSIHAAAVEIWHRYRAARPDAPLEAERAPVFVAALHWLVAQRGSAKLSYASVALAHRVDAKAVARCSREIERVVGR